MLKVFNITLIVNTLHGVLSHSQWLQQLLGIVYFYCEYAFDCPFTQHLLCTMAPVIAIQTLIVIFLQNRWIDINYFVQLTCLLALYFSWVLCEQNYIDKMLFVMEELFGICLRREGVG